MTCWIVLVSVASLSTLGREVLVMLVQCSLEMASKQSQDDNQMELLESSNYHVSRPSSDSPGVGVGVGLRATRYYRTRRHGLMPNQPMSVHRVRRVKTTTAHEAILRNPSGPSDMVLDAQVSFFFL